MMNRMKKQILLVTAVSFALALTPIVHAQQEQKLDSKISAIDTNEATESGRHQCLDNPEAMSACRSFIKGFLQGALLTDTAIIKSIIEDSEPTYAERASRTRLGRKSNQPTALAGFCLPEDRSILELAEETLGQVKESERNSVELAQNVYRSLKANYPCD